MLLMNLDAQFESFWKFDMIRILRILLSEPLVNQEMTFSGSIILGENSISLFGTSFSYAIFPAPS